MAEVKRAYRRLAKAYHPDSAGEEALPRFLAIHEAYEAIRTGRPMAPGRRPTASTASTTSRAEPWRADPERAQRAREQARRRAGARPGAAGAGTAAGNAGAGTGAPPRGNGAGAGADSGTAGTRGGARPSGTAGAGARSNAGGATGTSGRAGGGRGGRRHVRKATMGSTSYDEARDPADPNDPTWSGASWYGPSTGEYWIINPREYADPRKHGPEYQSRARRMAAAAGLGEAAEPVGDEATFDEAATFDEGSGAKSPRAQTSVRAARTRTRPRAEVPRSEAPTAGGEATWTFGTAEPVSRPRQAHAGAAAAADAAASPRATAASPRPRDAWGSTWPADARSIREGRRRASPGLSPRDLVGTATDDPIRRLGIALVAWPPIGLAAAALIGDVTGCASFSATCGGTEPLLPWLAQAGILGLLLLLPPIARLLAGGAIGVLVALVPITAFLVAVGGSGAPQAGFALSFLLGLAWLGGVAWAVAQTRRRGVQRAAT
jgi:hypothetical protein